MLLQIIKLLTKKNNTKLNMISKHFLNLNPSIMSSKRLTRCDNITQNITEESRLDPWEYKRIQLMPASTFGLISKRGKRRAINMSINFMTLQLR
jgi:hypothetical protein